MYTKNHWKECKNYLFNLWIEAIREKKIDNKVVQARGEIY